MPLSNINGEIDFNNLDVNLDLVSNLGNSIIKILGNLNEQNANLKINSDKLVLKDCIKLLNLNIPFKDDIGKISIRFKDNYNGNIQNISPNGINAKGELLANRGMLLSIENTPFEIINGQLKNVQLKGLFKNSPYNINLTATNILSDQQLINGKFNFRLFGYLYPKICETIY